MPVQFKFRGEKSFRSLLNVTTPCTLQRVKTAIYEQARISDSATDLALEDAATGQTIDPRALLTPEALVQLVVRRTPFQQDALAVQLDASDEGALRTEEDLAIDRIVDQHDVNAMGMSAATGPGALARYSRSYRLALASSQRQREGYEGESDEDEVFEAVDPPPPNYTCYRCGTTGGKPESHWIWECPTNDDPDHVKKVRTARGVPRAFLQKVSSIEEGQELSAGGVTFTLPGHSGHYIIAHQEASYEDKKMRVGDTVQEKITTAFTAGARMVEESLKCTLCRQMFRQAILAPCCGATYCSDCIMDRLAHSSVENSSCPGCGKEVLAHQLVANEDIRRQVDKITQSSKATAIAAQKEKAQRDRTEHLKALEVNAGTRDPVPRLRQHGSDDFGEMLALTDGSSAAAAPSSAAAVSRRTTPEAAAWQPLAFGPRLSPEQFAAWQQVIRASPPTHVAKREFEDWQHRLRQSSMPAMTSSMLVALPPQQPQVLPLPRQPQVLQLPAPVAPVPGPPSRESFEEWQRMLREGDGGRSPSGGDRKRAKKERKEKERRPRG